MKLKSYNLSFALGILMTLEKLQNQAVNFTLRALEKEFRP